MKVLVIGSGAREHCLAWKIAQSSLVDKIFCAPGNGGTSLIAENVDISVSDIDGLLKFALDRKIDLTVVGPEAPLVDGIVDIFESKELKIFGPRKELAMLEGSKVFAKEMMKKYNIPTADFGVFDDADKARQYISRKGAPIVVKADGLAAGKGVIVAKTVDEACSAVDSMIVDKKFGQAGTKVVVEECLEGEEASVLIFTDGEAIVPLVVSQDHKRAFDEDKGPNTGGMGAYAPAPLADDVLMAKVRDKICVPMIEGLKKDGRPYKGMLYVGVMVKDNEPYVLEFNVRFGDPETQVVLPKLTSDLAELMLRTIDNKLSGVELTWDERFCLCVVLASGGYPGSYEKGKVISGLDIVKDAFVFHAGTKKGEKGSFITSGGRVLSVVAMGESVKKARENVYNAIKDISFDKMHFRRDIGNKALKFYS